MKRSILKRLQVYMILFGVFMGGVFPVYANFFVIWKEGMLVYFVIGCMFAGIAVGVVGFLFVKVVLVKPLRQVSEIADNISNKSLNRTINIKSDDEVGVIINGLNASVKSIRSMLNELQGICDISQILLSRVKQDNKKKLRGASVDSSLEVVNNATSVISGHSTEIQGVVDGSQKSVRVWQDSLSVTIKNVKNLNSKMNSLVNNSEKINGIMTAVKEIAGKTNMVSLNASIEANKAGEQGRSFAVVAVEIRKLSASVAESSEQIAEYINLIRNDIEEANQSLKKIDELVGQNCQSSNTIYAELQDIDRISNSNITADQDLVASVNGLNATFKSVDGVIQSLSENTRHIKKVVESYQV